MHVCIDGIGQHGYEQLRGEVSQIEDEVLIQMAGPTYLYVCVQKRKRFFQAYKVRDSVLEHRKRPILRGESEDHVVALVVFSYIDQ